MIQAIFKDFLTGLENIRSLSARVQLTLDKIEIIKHLLKHTISQEAKKQNTVGIFLSLQTEDKEVKENTK